MRSKFVNQLLGNEENNSVYLKKQTDERFKTARLMLTGILKNQYYRSADAAAEEARTLLLDMAIIDPMYLLKSACFARELNMKGMVKLAVVALNSKATDEFLTDVQVHSSIVNLLKTFHPGQLLQFVELCKSKKFGKGFGARPQKWVRSAMESWHINKVEEYTLKYPTALNSLLRLVHPRYTDERGNMVKYVLNEKSAFGPRQIAAQTLKGMVGQDSSEVVQFIMNNNIPFDLVKGIGFKMDKNIGAGMLSQMGLTALLLNLRSLDEHNVFDSEEGLALLRSKMEEVKNGRSIPLDFAKPYIYSRNDKVKSILEGAIVDTLKIPMESINDVDVGVSLDISGSMHGEAILTAGLLAVPFLNAQSLWFTTFNNCLHEEGNKIMGENNWGYGKNQCPKLKGLSPQNQVRRLLSIQPSGGTNVAVSLEYMLQTKKRLDLHVIVTDEQQNSGTPLMHAWKNYKKNVNPEASLWIINASNYEWSGVDYNDPSVIVYQTMTPAIFKSVQMLNRNLVQEITEYKL